MTVTEIVMTILNLNDSDFLAHSLLEVAEFNSNFTF